MKKKLIFLMTLALIFTSNLYGQDSYQTFANAGFKVKCGCKLYVNTLFINMAKEQGMNNVLAAYLCAENENNPDIGVINNVNIYDESSSYKKINPTDYALFEKNYLEEYATNLKNAGMRYAYVTFQGVSALEYSFDQQGLPTKALIFLKNKKSYLLQVGTSMNLNTKYSLLKSSFVIL